jgi:hypothetical protein
MSALGIVLAVSGVASALLVWRHDLRRLRVEASAPQAAPKRIAPEVHVLSAGLTGLGVGLLWGFFIALGAVAVQITLAYVVLPRLLERLVYGPPRGSSH